MKKLHIVMPMAGEGSRFKEMGYDTPKPFLKIDDIEIYRRALNGLKFKNVEINYSFIVRKEFIDDYHVDDIIKKDYPNANIISVEKTTRGALETVLLARKFFKEDEAILIMDCDMEFICERYNSMIITELNHEEPYPMLLSFYSKDPKYSYAFIKGKNHNQAIATIEKKVVSNHALLGCYFVGDMKRFLKCCDQLLYDFDKGLIKSKELYVSLIYNYLIKDCQKPIKLCNMNFFTDNLWSYGTPKDYENHREDMNLWDDMFYIKK